MEQFKPWKILSVVGSIVVIAALTYYALLPSVYDLKVSQMNMQHNLILELMFCKFELGHSLYYGSYQKHLLCKKGEGDYSTVTKWFKKFHLN